VSKPLDAPLSDVMTSPAVSVTLKEPLHLAIRTMEEGGYRHLPIVDRQGRPVGVLTVGRIVHYLVEHFPGTIYNQPPEPHRYPEAPEGA
jgi:predicted transcriptional regulator